MALDARTRGCKIDGHTNDTDALTKAAQEAVDTGQELYVPSGICIVEGAELPSELVMFGAGIDRTVFRAPLTAPDRAGYAPILYASHRASLRLFDFAIDGYQQNRPTGTGNIVGLLLEECSDFDIHDVEVRSAIWGIVVHGSRDPETTTRSRIVDCIVANNHSLAIWARATFGRLDVRGNFVVDNAGGGIWFMPGEGARGNDIICVGNHLERNGFDGGPRQGILFWSTTWPRADAAVDLEQGAYQIDDFECSWNEVRQTGTYGILLGARNGRVIGNRCSDNGDSTWAGIDALCEDIAFRANQCFRNDRFGIDAGGSLRCVFEDNVCRDNGTRMDGVGLNLGGNRGSRASGNVLEGNRHWRDGGAQLALGRYEQGSPVYGFPWDARDCELIGNHLWVSPGTLGMRIEQDPWGMKVEGNHARNVEGSAAFLIESTKVVLRDNADHFDLSSPAATRALMPDVAGTLMIPPHVERIEVSGDRPMVFITTIHTDWTRSAYRSVFAVRAIDHGKGYKLFLPPVQVEAPPHGETPKITATIHQDLGVVANFMVTREVGSGYEAEPAVVVARPPLDLPPLDPLARAATARAFVSGLGESPLNGQVDGMRLSIWFAGAFPVQVVSSPGLRLAMPLGFFGLNDYLFLRGEDGAWVEAARISAERSFVRSDDGTPWLLCAGARIEFSDAATFLRLSAGQPVRRISMDVLSGISTIPRDGSLLVEEDGTMSAFYGGARLPFDRASYDRLYPGEKLYTVWTGALAKLATVPVGIKVVVARIFRQRLDQLSDGSPG